MQSADGRVDICCSPIGISLTSQDIIYLVDAANDVIGIVADGTDGRTHHDRNARVSLIKYYKYFYIDLCVNRFLNITTILQLIHAVIIYHLIYVFLSKKRKKENTPPYKINEK